MTVKRIVPNIITDQPETTKAFYHDILGMKIVMDMRGIVTVAADNNITPQISFANEDGSGTSVPDLSIEADNLAEAYQRVLHAGLSIQCGPAKEPWCVERFYFCGPFGRQLNILTHNK